MKRAPNLPTRPECSAPLRIVVGDEAYELTGNLDIGVTILQKRRRNESLNALCLSDEAMLPLAEAIVAFHKQREAERVALGRVDMADVPVPSPGPQTSLFDGTKRPMTGAEFIAACDAMRSGKGIQFDDDALREMGVLPDEDEPAAGDEVPR